MARALHSQEYICLGWLTSASLCYSSLPQWISGQKSPGGPPAWIPTSQTGRDSTANGFPPASNKARTWLPGIAHPSGKPIPFLTVLIYWTHTALKPNNYRIFLPFLFNLYCIFSHYHLVPLYPSPPTNHFFCRRFTTLDFFLMIGIVIYFDGNW